MWKCKRCGDSIHMEVQKFNLRSVKKDGSEGDSLYSWTNVGVPPIYRCNCGKEGKKPSDIADWVED